MLEPDLGVGDAWSFIDAADREWSDGNLGWGVDFEYEPARASSDIQQR